MSLLCQVYELTGLTFDGAIDSLHTELSLDLQEPATPPSCRSSVANSEALGRGANGRPLVRIHIDALELSGPGLSITITGIDITLKADQYSKWLKRTAMEAEAGPSDTASRAGGGRRAPQA